MYDIEDKSSAIYDLQNMLGLLARYDKRLIKVYPDGFYGEATEQAVIRYSETRGFGRRRVVDDELFYSIANEYRTISDFASGGVKVNVFPLNLNDGVISKGDKASYISVVQVMFFEMGDVCEEYSRVEINGIYDDNTEVALEKFREIHKVGNSDVIDRETWDSLATEYNNRKMITERQ